MTLSSSEIKTLRHQFECLCRTILRNEVRNYYKQLNRRADREIPISGLSETEFAQLYTMDDYPSDYTYFDVLEYRVAVQDDRLAEVLASLSNKKRDVVLLSYFLDMTDTEIAERLQVVRTTIYRRRTNSLKEMKIKLEEVLNDGQD